MGCPVIATNVGGVSSLIVNSETGFLIPANDPYQLVYLLLLLYNDKQLNIDMGIKAKEIARKRHSVNDIVNSILNTYNLILEKMLKFSVVTVCFNAENTIQETMFSVLNQTYKNIEYIIIDGKSKDNTLSVISKMQSQYSQRDIKVVSESDKGIYDAMNKALKIASGDFLIFLGADDHFISANVLERFSVFMTDNNCNYYGNVLRPLKNDLYCGKFNKYKLAVKNIPHQAIFIVRMCIKNILMI